MCNLGTSSHNKCSGELQECQLTELLKLKRVEFLSQLNCKHLASYQCLIFVCRRRNDRPWQKRWIVFIAEELKYYKTKGVKV